MVYFLLWQNGDGGVKAEESKYAPQVILNFHGTLPAVIGIVLDGVQSDEVSRIAVSDGRAGVVPVEDRDFCEVPVVVRM